VITNEVAQSHIADFQERLQAHRQYAIEYGDDPEEITNWVWESRS